MENKTWSSVNDVRREISDSFGSEELPPAVVDSLARRVWLMADHASGRAVLSIEAWEALDLDAMAREIEAAR